MKVAIVHDQLYVYGGAEKVLAEIIACYPEADLFALFDTLPENQRGFLKGKTVTPTPLQRFPGLNRWHRHYFLLMPLLIEQLDLSAYDVIISSSYLVAKGIVVGPDQLHISYVHSPMRYAWDLQHQYLSDMKLRRGLRSLVVRCGLHYMRVWDRRSGTGVDAYATNSRFVARRLKKVYGREATVVYPPVDVERFACRFGDEEREPYFVTVSRLVPYKRVDLIVEAFAGRPDLRLVVIGEGPELERIRGLAGPNVTVLSHQPEQAVVDHLQRATAFVYAAEEDFGIAPVEAQACGTPVVAYGKGDVLETVVGPQSPNPTGIFYRERTIEALHEALDVLLSQRWRFRAAACCANAARFSRERFNDEFKRFAEREIAVFQRQLADDNGVPRPPTLRAIDGQA